VGNDLSHLFPDHRADAQEANLEGHKIMAVVANRRSVMTLFSRPTDIHSHRTRLVLAEKNINIEITNVMGPDLPEDLMDLNPYHTVPTLVDRDLTLYDSRVIIEYLDERFPHPPLMPVDPVTRAQFRLALFRIEMDWYSIAQETESSVDGKLGTKARKMLRESILQSMELFGARPYFLSEEFSLVDCTIAPLLWRLPVYGIDLGKDAEPIEEYMDRVFARRSFQQSLTELEQEMRL
jgi:RNA polymerase-associated protein